MGLLRQQEVAALLEGVGLLRSRVDADHAAPDGGRRVAEDAAEGEVRDGVGGGVFLRRVVVEVLLTPAGIGPGDTALGALAGEIGLHPHLAPRRAEAERGPVENGVAA